MKRLLVPCDGSDNALRAVGHVAAMAGFSRSPLEADLLHVLDPVTVRAAGGALAPDELARLQERETERVLVPAAFVLAEANVPFRRCSRVGQPASEIAAQANEAGYGGIVMGTRGLGPLASLAMGSVASRVVSLVRIPVTLVTRAVGGAMQRILVPCDGSDNALRAVAHAADLARDSTTAPEITLLYVLDPLVFTSLGETLKPGALERARPLDVERVLGPAERVLREAGVACRVAWRVGEPAPEIAAELADKAYDAVVMGTRGIGPVANLVIGSVASRVQCLAGVPLTLVK